MEETTASHEELLHSKSGVPVSKGGEESRWTYCDFRELTGRHDGHDDGGACLCSKAIPWVPFHPVGDESKFLIVQHSHSSKRWGSRLPKQKEETVFWLWIRKNPDPVAHGSQAKRRDFFLTELAKRLRKIADTMKMVAKLIQLKVWGKVMVLRLKILPIGYVTRFYTRTRVEFEQ